MAITPFARPEALGDQALLTAEEVASLASDVVDRNRRVLDRPAERTSAGGNVDSRADGTPGFDNNFWLDGGLRTVGTRRTSGFSPIWLQLSQKKTVRRRALPMEIGRNLSTALKSTVIARQ